MECAGIETAESLKSLTQIALRALSGISALQSVEKRMPLHTKKPSPERNLRASFG